MPTVFISEKYFGPFEDLLVGLRSLIDFLCFQDMAFIEGLQSVTHISSSSNYLLEFREHRQALIAMKVGLSYIINNRYLIIVCLNLITQINSI